jgi:N-acetylneuraminic acid mutarotase
MPQMPKAMAGGGAAVINHVLHYFGGNDSNRLDAGDHFALDLTNTAAGWQTKASMTDPRSHFGYTLFDGKIYTIGGQHGNDAALTTVKTVEVYDPATNAWTTKAPLPVAVSHFASACFVLGNRIVVAGGETANEMPTNRVTAYDPVANTWTSMTSLPAARFSGVGAVIDGAIYFTTGSSLTTTWKGVLI